MAEIHCGAVNWPFLIIAYDRAASNLASRLGSRDEIRSELSRLSDKLAPVLDPELNDLVLVFLGILAEAYAAQGLGVEVTRWGS